MHNAVDNKKNNIKQISRANNKLIYN